MSDERDRRAALRTAFFNRCASDWMAVCYHGPDGRMRQEEDTAIRALLAAVPLGRSASILDVGCGSGVLVPYLLAGLDDGGRVVELDSAQGMIDENRRLHDDPRVRFVTGDLLGVELRMGPFDAAVCFSCFPHFDDKPAALAALHDRLRPGGVLAIAHTMSCAEMNDFHRAKDAAVREDRMLPVEALAGLLRETGFDVLRAEDRPGWYLATAVRSTLRPPGRRTRRNRPGCRLRATGSRCGGAD